MKTIEFNMLFVLPLILFVLPGGHGLTCYSCSAGTGHGAPCEKISNHLSDISHQECFFDNAVCATYKIDYGNNVVIYRSCRSDGVCLALSKKYDSQYNKLLECQTCDDGDLCNSAIPKMPALFLLINAVFLLILYYCKLG